MIAILTTMQYVFYVCTMYTYMLYACTLIWKPINPDRAALFDLDLLGIEKESKDQVYIEINV